MNTINYSIELFDYWSTTAGLSGGALADSLCIKDPNGLPYLPGKTIKGLMREATSELSDTESELFTPAFINNVFGEIERHPNDKLAGTPTKVAVSFFSDATLEELTAQEIIKTDLKQQLFEYLASTAIESNGMAKDGSLRRIEYALPCTLYGSVYNVSSEYRTQLVHCANFVKRLGYNRHRGFGRCKITIL